MSRVLSLLLLLAPALAMGGTTVQLPAGAGQEWSEALALAGLDASASEARVVVRSEGPRWRVEVRQGGAVVRTAYVEVPRTAEERVEVAWLLASLAEDLVGPVGAREAPAAIADPPDAPQAIAAVPPSPGASSDALEVTARAPFPQERSVPATPRAPAPGDPGSPEVARAEQGTRSTPAGVPEASPKVETPEASVAVSAVDAAGPPSTSDDPVAPDVPAPETASAVVGAAPSVASEDPPREVEVVTTEERVSEAPVVPVRPVATDMAGSEAPGDVAEAVATAAAMPEALGAALEAASPDVVASASAGVEASGAPAEAPVPAAVPSAPGPDPGVAVTTDGPPPTSTPSAPAASGAVDPPLEVSLAGEAVARAEPAGAWTGGTRERLRTPRARSVRARGVRSEDVARAPDTGGERRRVAVAPDLTVRSAVGVRSGASPAGRLGLGAGLRLAGHGLIGLGGTVGLAERPDIDGADPVTMGDVFFAAGWGPEWTWRPRVEVVVGLEQRTFVDAGQVVGSGWTPHVGGRVAALRSLSQGFALGVQAAVRHDLRATEVLLVDALVEAWSPTAFDVGLLVTWDLP